ncbi:hypothetical protein SEUCBS140593_000738 [Sporothrix eucalyptigena]|uniref:Uncharacterized protein n=1 Tax=Sporothrix eucalyptigena TaxID=1812306 RepID=A0ABP0ASB8_9PEZI
MVASTKLSNAEKSTCVSSSALALSRAVLRLHTCTKSISTHSKGRDNVEGPYYFYSGRNMYDIRRPAHDTIVPQDFVRFLGLASTRAALGIDSIPELATAAMMTDTAAGALLPQPFTYASESEEVYTAFTRAGDYLYPAFLADLEYLLDHGVRVILMHGDADYIANWLGGEAVSLALNHSQANLFRTTPYTPLVFGDAGPDYGKVREFGNLSFAVVHDAGHFVSFDQPALALELFRRAMASLDLPMGRGPTNSSAFPFVPDSPLTAEALPR